VVNTTLGMNSPKNVLMIIADDLRMQLECESLPGTVRPHMHTPHLCDLASQSLHLLQNHAPMSHCSPSRTATLTGRSVGTTHVWDLATYFRNQTGNFTTIPQFFWRKGYRTKAIGKIYHGGITSGFGKSHTCPLCSVHNPQDQVFSWSEKVFRPQELHGEKSKEKSWRVVPDDTPLRDTQTMHHAIETIHEYGAEKNPFFLAVGFHKPHLPWVVPNRFFQYYDLKDIKLPLNPYVPFNLPTFALTPSKELRSYHDVRDLWSGAMNTTLPDWKTKELRRAYYAAVSYTDHNVGQVLAALRDAHLEEETIVIFWGDHGWSLGEHARWGKHTNSDTDTHCPLMIRVPGLTDGGSKSDQLTGLIDLFPTLVELVFGKHVLKQELPYCPPDSSDVETCREGLSLVPLLQNPKNKIRDRIYTAYGRGTLVVNGHERSYCLFDHCTMVYSMQTYINKKIYRYTEGVLWMNMKPMWNRVKGMELYNRFDDPEEKYNIVDEVSPVLLAKLRRQLRNGSVWRGTPN